MKIDGAVAFPHSLGLYYSAVTQYLGFPKYGDEYKVMGLAAYGQPESLDVFRDIVRFDPDSRANGFRAWARLFYSPPHRPGDELGRREKNADFRQSCFPTRMARGLDQHGRRKLRWSSGTRIFQRHCRLDSKRFTLAC